MHCLFYCSMLYILLLETWKCFLYTFQNEIIRINSYFQVVTLATYAFFGACIFGRQYVDAPDKPNHNFELYIPIFTICQLFFYMGLLKVSFMFLCSFNVLPTTKKL